MFNARNELDQSRFVDDLSESIAEMDEMETIRAHNHIETIHFRQQERLRRHAMSHAISENQADEKVSRQTHKSATNQKSCDTTRRQHNQVVGETQRELENHRRSSDDQVISRREAQESEKIPISETSQRERKHRSKFNSMLNLSSNDNDECKTQPKSLKLNHSFVQDRDQRQPHRSIDQPERSQNDSGSSRQRRCSTNSIHSLDSGLFLSRDISPNQSS